MRAPGAILLVACYELGHQPLAVSWPAAVLEGLGYRPACLDVSLQPFDEGKANPTVKNFVKYVGNSKLSGFASWGSRLTLRPFKAVGSRDWRRCGGYCDRVAG